MRAASSPDEFTFERHGDVMLITASPALETIDSTLVDQAASLMLEPVRAEDSPLVVVDLSPIDFFGSALLNLLVRCWRLAEVKGGTMVLSGVSDRARELLRITSLDFVWPIYNTQREAIEALQSD